MGALDKINAVPTYEFTVPSTQEIIKFRPFVHKEEKVLQIAKSSNNIETYMSAIKDTIKACTFGIFDPDKYATYDIEDFFLRLREKSISETMDVVLLCQHPGNSKEGTCDAECPITIPLAEIHIDAEQASADNYKIQLSDTVGVELKAPAFDTLEKLAQLHEDPDAVGIGEILATMVKCIFTQDEVIPANECTKEELVNFIESLTSNQIDKISEVLRNTPTISYRAVTNCPKCGKEVSYTFRGIYDFFV